MREKRLDYEEALAEEKKNCDTMKKELEGLQKKAKIIDASLKTAQNDLEAFQASIGYLLLLTLVKGYYGHLNSPIVTYCLIQFLEASFESTINYL